MTALRNSASQILHRMAPRWSHNGPEGGFLEPKIGHDRPNWLQTGRPIQYYRPKRTTLRSRGHVLIPSLLFSSLLFPSLISYHVKLLCFFFCFLSSLFSSLPTHPFSLRFAALPPLLLCCLIFSLVSISNVFIILFPLLFASLILSYLF